MEKKRDEPERSSQAIPTTLSLGRGGGILESFLVGHGRSSLVRLLSA